MQSSQRGFHRVLPRTHPLPFPTHLVGRKHTEYLSTFLDHVDPWLKSPMARVLAPFRQDMACASRAFVSSA